MGYISKELREDLYTEVIKKYGPRSQMIVAIEELSELQKEICKNLRGNENNAEIAEEIADCLIVIEQLCLIFNVKPEEWMTRKINRLRQRVSE